MIWHVVQCCSAAYASIQHMYAYTLCQFFCMFDLFGRVSKWKLHLLTRKEDCATPGDIASTAVVASRAAENSVATAATTAAEGTAARQRLHSRHAASPAAPLQLPLQLPLRLLLSAGLLCPGLQVVALHKLPLLVQLVALWPPELPVPQGLHQAALCLKLPLLQLPCRLCPAALCLQLALLVMLRLLPTTALPPLVPLLQAVHLDLGWAGPQAMPLL